MTATTDTRPRGLLVILATLVALGPLTIDMYLPAMPGMVDALGTNAAMVQLTLSAYLLGFSIFHLFCGPLADRFGRRPVLFAGLALFTLASLACAAATTIEQLIFFRFLQGVAACVGPTLGRAIARDLFGPQRAARALAHIAMIMALAPAIAPTLGGIMLQFLPWPSIFFALAAYAVITFAAAWLRLPESLPVVQPLHLGQIARNYLQLLRDRHYLLTSCASALLYAGMVAFLASSGFIFIDMMGVPTRFFGALFLTTVIGYIAGSALSTRLALGRESEQVMWLGVQGSLTAAIVMLAASERWFHPGSIILPMAAYSASLGVVLPHAMGAALRHFPHMAGTASALFGFIQMGLSSLAGVVVGVALTDSPRPMILTLLLASVVSMLLINRLRPR